MTSLAPFSQNAPLTLAPAPNGGWVVSCYQPDGPERAPDVLLGAFTDTADMLRALADALDPEGTAVFRVETAVSAEGEDLDG
ncbi:hypothetical protein EBL89_03565 [Cereibacter sphaeroides]|uniref:hypothetical protein n=1 Tax=Cereibacter sphaeroides TaxID=1063 RepID=UPI000F54A278|nr:hypothetical protein [Cereibacter sphaeroides]AZB54443.1 hypothetical protein EBL89_03565 [Cereibacter sphaeroides]AZB58697.1 hypothetical protein EBL88_03550 [Cereibacter sphaeroides]